MSHGDTGFSISEGLQLPASHIPISMHDADAEGTRRILSFERREQRGQEFRCAEALQPFLFPFE